MPTLPSNKYQLKTLHQEIDLFDRKIAHLLKYEAFPSNAERDAAAGKMAAKRELLVRNARQMAADGITFAPADLPRSLRDAETPEVAVSTEPAPSQASPAVAADAPAGGPQPSPYAGTALDFQKSLEGYKRNKKRA